MGLSLSDADVARLTQRTEGWITGLQLSALSMPADSDSAGLGSHRPILDYLGQEVLARQPAGVRTFLLRTSVLNRLNSSLCSAVVGNDGPNDAAQAMLEQIERANLFLTALDGERRWYRYHTFFAEFLRVHLDRTEPDLVPALHQRATEWYACHGDVRAAIHHALAASNQDRAARLIEQHGMAIFDGAQLKTLLGWFKRLSPDSEHSRPLLGTLRAFVLFGSNQVHAAEGLLQSIDRHFPTDVPADEARIARGRMVLLRALIASVGPDRTRSAAAAAAAQTLNLVASPDEATEVLAGLLAVQALSVTGDVTAAREQVAAEAVERAKVAGYPVALRVALGGGQGRILRQLLTESLLVATPGGIAGLAFSWIGARVILAMVAGTSTRPTGLTGDVDIRVLLFTALVFAIGSLFPPLLHDWNMLIAVQVIRGLAVGAFIPAALGFVLRSLAPRWWMWGIAGAILARKSSMVATLPADPENV